jgi:hypothetical protein
MVINKTRTQIMELLRSLYHTIVVGNQKALVGFILTFIATLGVTGDMTVAQVIESAVSAVVVAGGVWLKSNR